jgi:hypothetical protein
MRNSDLVLEILDPKEKARMDYQMELDQRKITKGGSKLKEICVERGWFGAFIALLTALAVGAVGCISECSRRNNERDLEGFKSFESRNRFFMERRLESINRDTAAMSAASAVYFRNTLQDQGETPAEAKKQYREALDKAREAINAGQPYFDKATNTDIDRYYELHNQMQMLDPSKWRQFRDFMEAIEDDVTKLTTIILENLERTGAVGDVSDLHLPLMKKSEMGFPGPEDYLRRQRDNYNEAHQK